MLRAKNLLAASVKWIPSQETNLDGSAHVVDAGVPQNAMKLKLLGLTAPAARGQWPVAETVQGRGRHGLDHGAVHVGVEEGQGPAVVAPELPEHHPQHVVVVLGECVDEPRDAASFCGSQPIW